MLSSWTFEWQSYRGVSLHQRNGHCEEPLTDVSLRQYILLLLRDCICALSIRVTTNASLSDQRWISAEAEGGRDIGVILAEALR